MHRFFRISIIAAVSIFTLIALVERTASATECPNKFGAQKEVSGGADTQADAEKQLAKALATALATEAKECKEKTCEEKKTTCRFLHTVTKPKCKPGPGDPAPKFICSQWYRAGCFCLKDDEQIELKAVRRRGPAE